MCFLRRAALVSVVYGNTFYRISTHAWLQYLSVGGEFTENGNVKERELFILSFGIEGLTYFFWVEVREYMEFPTLLFELTLWSIANRIGIGHRLAIRANQWRNRKKETFLMSLHLIDIVEWVRILYWESRFWGCTNRSHQFLKVLGGGREGFGDVFPR